MLIEIIQNIIPQRLKQILKPYFRVIFPNKLMCVLWITFRCTYKCSYCPYCGSESNFHEHFPISCEKNGKEWIEAMEKLPPTSFYIAGGEPFLYKDLPYIINNLPKKHSILGLVTNLSMPIDVYKKINKRLHMNVSFHREFVGEDEFISKVLELKNYHHVNVNIVATEDNYDFIKNKISVFKENNISCHVDPLMENANTPHQYNDEYAKLLNERFKYDKNLVLNSDRLISNKIRRCSAGKNYYNLLPNGDALICARAMDHKYSPFVDKDNSNQACLGNIFNDTFVLNKNCFICKYDCLCHCDWDYTTFEFINDQELK